MFIHTISRCLPHRQPSSARVVIVGVVLTIFDSSPREKERSREQKSSQGFGYYGIVPWHCIQNGIVPWRHKAKYLGLIMDTRLSSVTLINFFLNCVQGLLSAVYSFVGRSSFVSSLFRSFRSFSRLVPVYKIKIYAAPYLAIRAAKFYTKRFHVF